MPTYTVRGMLGEAFALYYGCMSWALPRLGASPRVGADGNRKYQFMEMNLQKRVAGLKDKIPEIQKTLDTVRFLKLQRVRLLPVPHPIRNRG